MRRRSALAVLYTALNLSIVFAQGGVQEYKAAPLEVVSIKVSHEDRGGMLSIQPGGRLIASNIRVRDMFNMAFAANPGLTPQQILGFPAWTTSVRYNLEARFAVGDGTVVVGEGIRAILNTRFAFQAHLEKRVMPVYVVSLAPGGFKPPPAPFDCTVDFTPCRVQYASGRITGRHMPIDTLILELQRAGRPVVNQTGLEGRFDIDLQYNPEALVDPTDNRPSLFGAAQELGLRLIPKDASIDVLIIDHVEPPTED